MIFSKENRDDIIKYYNKAIVKFPETGDRLWCVSDIGYDEITCVDVDGFEIIVDLDAEYEVDYPLPGRVVYQMGKNATMLVRKPAKQYIRGISNSNTMLLFLTSLGDWKQTDVSLKNLQQFVDKPAYQDINTVNWDELQSAALNRHFSVSKFQNIYALTKKIGEFSPQDKKYYVHPMFEQEIGELFKGWTKV